MPYGHKCVFNLPNASAAVPATCKAHKVEITC